MLFPFQEVTYTPTPARRGVLRCDIILRLPLA